MPDGVVAKHGLDYAPGAPHRRRKRIRRIVVAALFLAVSGGLWFWHKPLWTHTRLLNEQHQCAIFTLSSDQIVYDEDATASVLLLNRADYTKVDPWGVGLRTGVGYSPKCLSLFRADCPSSPNKAFESGPMPAVLFLHERASRTGIYRLLWVQFNPMDTPYFSAPFGLRAEIIEPAYWNSWPKQCQHVLYHGVMTYHGPGLPHVHLRFYSGQADPSDPAHFTIRYEMDAEHGGRGGGTIDGRLDDDGNRVRFTVRDGPAMPPSPWGTPMYPIP